MTGRPALRSLVALLAAAVVAIPVAHASKTTGRSELSPLARVAVAGSGPIAWSSVSARSRPSRSAPVVRTLSQFRDDYYPRWVMALRARTDAAGKPTWYEIALPGRPNGARGWVPAASVDLRPVDRWLVVYRDSRKFEFYVDGRLKRVGKIAVGAPGMETPVGLFYVQSKFRPQRYPILGSYAFETSGYSKLSDWPGGGVVGFHGTPWPWLLGQAVSHGCVRTHNASMDYLRTRVPLGTPVKIVAA